MPDQLTPKEAAAYLGVSESWLAAMRGGAKSWDPAGKGPRFASPNGYHIWYRKDWLDEWKDSIWAGRCRAQEPACGAETKNPSS